MTLTLPFDSQKNWHLMKVFSSKLWKCFYWDCYWSNILKISRFTLLDFLVCRVEKEESSLPQIFLSIDGSSLLGCFDEMWPRPYETTTCAHLHNTNHTNVLKCSQVLLKVKDTSGEYKENFSFDFIGQELWLKDVAWVRSTVWKL